MGRQNQHPLVVIGCELGLFKVQGVAVLSKGIGGLVFRNGRQWVAFACIGISLIV